MSARANGAGRAVDPNRAKALKTFKRYERVFGPAFRQAVRDAGATNGASEVTATVQPKVVERTVTRTRTVDGGWRTKALDARAALRAVDRQMHSARSAAAQAASERAEAVAEAQRAVTEVNRVSDRLTVAESRAERLRAELAELRQLDLDARERATVSELVHDAEQRVEAAELRAARAERQAAEHAAAVTGELRALTADELAELKANGGPAGPAVMGAALKRLARARATGGKGPLREVLPEVARAALHWLERL